MHFLSRQYGVQTRIHQDLVTNVKARVKRQVVMLALVDVKKKKTLSADAKNEKPFFKKILITHKASHAGSATPTHHILCRRRRPRRCGKPCPWGGESEMRPVYFGGHETNDD